MTPLDLAKNYLECFFGKLPLENMRGLLADDLFFAGPFHQSTTAKSYLQALLNDPPVDASCKILHEFEKDDTACIIYEFSKPGVITNMVQVFEVSNGKIGKIALIFDSNAFATT